MKTINRILDYGYYCDLVELNTGNLRIDIDSLHAERLRRDYLENEDEDYMPNLEYVFEDIFPTHFDYLEFIPDLGQDERFGALTNSCAIYEPESGRLWWYPDYQIHNLFEKLIENKELVFTLAE